MDGFGSMKNINQHHLFGQLKEPLSNELWQIR